jgi:hypothetical protein
MTFFELRAKVILALMLLFRIKLQHLYDSYPYNPLSKKETEEFWAIKREILYAKRK